MTKRRSVAAAPFALSGLLALGGCVEDLRYVPPSSLALGDELLVANSISGERCRVRKTADDGTQLRIEDFVVLCDGWKQPAGQIRRFRLSASQSLEAVLQRDDLLLWDEARVDCQPMETSALADGETAWLRRCTTAEGWPAMAWAMRTRIDGAPGAMAAFGMPHLAPVVEQLALAGEAAGGAAGEGVEVRRAGTRSPLQALSEQESQRGGNQLSLAEIMDHGLLLKLAAAYNQIGDFASAASAIERALVLQRKDQDDASPFLAETYALLGLNLSSDGRIAEADIAFAKAEPLARRIDWSDTYDTYLTYRAVHERNKGDLEAALKLAGEASERRLQRHGHDSLELAHSRSAEAGILTELGRLDEARALMGSVTAALERQRDYGGLVFAHSRDAEIELLSGRLEEARAAVAEARRLAQLLYGDGANLGMVNGIEARIAVATGDAAAARKAYGDMARLSSGAAQAGNSMRVAELAPYLDLLLEQAASDGSALPEAFRAAQLVHGPIVDKAMRQMTARLAADDPEISRLVRTLQDEREALQDARQRLGALQLDAIADEDENPALPALQAEVAQLDAQVEKDERELQQRFPQFGRLTAPSVIDATTVAGLLEPGEGLLRFVVADDATYVLLIDDHGQVHGRKAPIGRGELSAQVGHLRQALTFANGLVPFDMAASHDLYRTLIGGLDLQLNKLDLVAVVADGPLLSLPPALLLRAPAVRYEQAAWLGADTALSMIGSVEAFVAMRRELKPSLAAKSFLGIGDPVLGGNGPTQAAVSQAAETCREGGMLDPLLLKALPSLPETADELRLVAKALGGSQNLIEIGEDATETTLKGLPLADYRVISFATHGLLPGELPCNAEPALVMTPPAPGTDPMTDNGLLDASEIATLNLDADWVVLSACNTAGPDGELGGEALSGLASAFIHAGARSMLVSHWDVASESTVRLMRKTFETYGQSMGAGGKAKALQAAQMDMMADPQLSHPAFWAAFTLIGDAGSLPQTAAGPSDMEFESGG